MNMLNMLKLLMPRRGMHTLGVGADTVGSNR